MARHKKLEAVEDEDPKLDISSLIDVCLDVYKRQRLRRFHKWNCPSLSRGKRDTAWLGMYGELAAASFLRAEGCVILRRNWRPVRGCLLYTSRCV